MDLDEWSQQRLSHVRARDKSGTYSVDEPVEGHDAKGALAITVDPLNRVSAVRVSDADLVRQAEALNAALDAAYSNALSRKRELSGADPGGETPAARPVARFTPATVRDPREFQGLHTDRSSRSLGRRSPRWGTVTGVSNNRCISISLEPASPRMDVLDVDQGWLSNARATNLAAALEEAFAAAYREREGRG